MLANRLKRYASAAVALSPNSPGSPGSPDSPNTGTPAMADLALPLSAATKLAGTGAFATAVETLALGDARRLYDQLCEADLSQALIWVELPAEEKERAREALLAARGQPLAAPDGRAATALTLGYLLAWNAETRRVAVSLMVESIDPYHGPLLSASHWELLIDLPTEQQRRGVARVPDACLNDLEGRMALRPSQWFWGDAPGDVLPGNELDYADLQAEALSIWSLVALLGNPRSHHIRTLAPADGIGRSGPDFLVIDLPETQG